VARAPSNVKDAAKGKSFTFITFVVRNGMGTLLRAASALVPTLLFDEPSTKRSHDCERGTHEAYATKIVACCKETKI